MGSQNGAENCGQVLFVGHLTREGYEMALQTRVDEKTSALVIHTANILAVDDLEIKYIFLKNKKECCSWKTRLKVLPVSLDQGLSGRTRKDNLYAVSLMQ